MKKSKKRRVFYRLVTRDALPYADTNADFVMCSSKEEIMSLANTVHSKNSPILAWCSPAQLKIYRDSASLNILNGALQNESALGESHGSAGIRDL